MDNFDLEILDRLQRNSRITTETLGIEIGLSATAVQRRIKKLKETGIIDKEIAVVNEAKLGSAVTVIIEVAMKRGGTDVIDAFQKKTQSFNCVQQCYYVAGENDFILIVKADSLQHYEEITRDLLLNDKNIHKFYSNIAMQNVKVGLEYPIRKDKRTIT
ncbi:Lrp/AsnC family transcriptional regulator [Marinomonas mediterranea]|jgi:Transcriptional regulators|uniref:Transcriptional regulator, AsnC family n=1 Tax=Marinomonas mediterranea (strain ATCC 700492 / JCM 21426 / NBRC 103028 / MMB-1) TaxID=717774 RepID=F2JYN2_MARM1|nr:Lrp/AsnC family transcriptional regulator [Marinomonas mediterranea]ADZ89657.1 transcriptional regulator, AsnC family [Marinomonas mediterranea MMB-1]WCN15894.1 AsnC family transcriptional regulator [Marinomonas mediterranea MMB-1]